MLLTLSARATKATVSIRYEDGRAATFRGVYNANYHPRTNTDYARYGDFDLTDHEVIVQNALRAGATSGAVKIQGRGDSFGDALSGDAAPPVGRVLVDGRHPRARRPHRVDARHEPPLARARVDDRRGDGAQVLWRRVARSGRRPGDRSPMRVPGWQVLRAEHRGLHRLIGPHRAA